MPPPEYSLIKGIPESQDKTGASVTLRASGKVLDAPVAELPMRPRVDKSRPAPVGVQAAVEPDRPITSIVKRPPAEASTGSGGQEVSPASGGQADAGSEASAQGGAHGGGRGKEPPVLRGEPGGEEGERHNQGGE